MYIFRILLYLLVFPGRKARYAWRQLENERTTVFLLSRTPRQSRGSFVCQQLLNQITPRQAASSLGWAIGAGVGAVLGGVDAGKGAGKVGYELVVSVVGDGTFLFGVPGSAFWMARQYETPFLTIVLNNGGWKSPKLSMLDVHPEGHGSKVSGNQLIVSFGSAMPNYVGIAVAATGGWAWGKRIATGDPLEETMVEAVRIVVEEQRCAIVECVLESI